MCGASATAVSSKQCQVKPTPRTVQASHIVCMNYMQVHMWHSAWHFIVHVYGLALYNVCRTFTFSVHIRAICCFVVNYV